MTHATLPPPTKPVFRDVKNFASWISSETYPSMNSQTDIDAYLDRRKRFRAQLTRYNL